MMYPKRFLEVTNALACRVGKEGRLGQSMWLESSEGKYFHLSEGIKWSLLQHLHSSLLRCSLLLSEGPISSFPPPHQNINQILV